MSTAGPRSLAVLKCGRERGEGYRPPAKFASMSKGAAAHRRMSQPIADLIGPEPLEPAERLVHALELVGRDAADLLYG
jgi:hypothetical protein